MECPYCAEDVPAGPAKCPACGEHLDGRPRGPRKPLRPTSVTVFAVLNFLFGGFGVLGSVVSIVFLSVGAALIPPGDPTWDAIRNDSFYSVYFLVSLVLGVLAAGVLIACGFGFLKLREWARKLAIGYCIYAFASIALALAINWFVIWAPVVDQGGPQAAGAIGGLFGSCLGVIYPGLMLYFMMRPNVKEAFAKGL